MLEEKTKPKWKLFVEQVRSERPGVGTWGGTRSRQPTAGSSWPLPRHAAATPLPRL